MVEMQDKEDVDYLERTVLDFNGWIFHNLHRKFSYQKLLLLTLKSKDENEFTKTLFIRFFE